MTTSPAEPPESTLAAVLAAHQTKQLWKAGGWAGDTACSCGWRMAMWSRKDFPPVHRAHVAAAILAATPIAARIAQLEADLAAAEAKLAAVEALASEWEREGGLAMGELGFKVQMWRDWKRVTGLRRALATHPAP